MDINQVQLLRAFVDVITDRLHKDRQEYLTALHHSAGTALSQQDQDVVVKELWGVLRTLTEAQAETNRLLQELIQALTKQPAQKAAVSLSPPRLLELERSDGSKVTIRELR